MHRNRHLRWAGQLAAIGLLVGCSVADSGSDARSARARLESRTPETFRSAAKCPECTVAAISKVSLPETGIDAIAAKVVPPPGVDRPAQIVTIAADGTVLGHDAVIKAERLSARARHGAMHANLEASLRSSPAGTKFRVWGWLAISVSTPRKEDLLADPVKLREHEDDAVAKISAALERVKLLAGSHGSAFRMTDTPYFEATLDDVALSLLNRSPDVVELGIDTASFARQSTYWHSAVRGPEALVLSSGTLTACVCEDSKPDDNSMLPGLGLFRIPDDDPDSHTRLVAGIVRNSGTATMTTSSTQHIGGIVGAADFSDAARWCITNGAYVINLSYDTSLDSGYGGGLSPTDMRIDYMAKHSPFPLFTLPSGNYGYIAGRETVLHRSYNSVVVGGSDDRGTPRGDDIIYYESSYKNPMSTHGDRELPYFVAPANAITAAGFTDRGTSYAAPMAAGAAILSASRNSDLRYWPEAMRAILLATPIENVDGMSLPWLPYGDHKDGTGVLNAHGATLLGDPLNKAYPNGGSASKYGHYYKTLDFVTDFDSNGVSKDTWTIRTTEAGWVRVAIAWDSTTNCSDTLTDCSSDTLDGDVDLEVLWSDGRLLTSSTSYDSSWETVEWYGAPGDFIIRLRRYSYSQPRTFFGLAWYSR